MRRLRFLALGSGLFACSLATTFDPEGQPCDKAEPNPYLQCLSDAGYFCVGGLCKKTNPPAGDGGSGGVDAGDAGDAGSKDGGNRLGNARVQRVLPVAVGGHLLGHPARGYQASSSSDTRCAFVFAREEDQATGPDCRRNIDTFGNVTSDCSADARQESVNMASRQRRKSWRREEPRRGRSSVGPTHRRT